MDNTTIVQAFSALRNSLDSYYPIQPESWSALQNICQCRTIEKGQLLYTAGKRPNSFSFVFKGLFRNFITDDKGNEYNKMFFDEGKFPGSMAALLTGQPSAFTIEALEPSIVIEIAFQPFRQLLQERHDLALFQIQYLEKNWLLSKEPREIALVQEEASQRYARFKAEYPTLHKRLPQYLIASHLGITPTQLSRIRKSQTLS